MSKVVSEGAQLVPFKNELGLYGYKCKTSGDVVVQPKYNYADTFIEGMALVKFDGSYGFINEEGEEIIRPSYKHAIDFSEGLAVVKDDDDYYYYIDKEGKRVLGRKCYWDNALSFSEGIAAVCQYQDEDCAGWWAYIDKEENFLCDYDWKSNEDGETGSFKNGFACVYDRDTKCYGFLNTNGELAFEYLFSWAGDFDDNGFCEVVKDGEEFKIDKNGNRVQ
jgi:hypothetical protein